MMGEAPMTGNGYRTCSEFGIGCLKPTTINLPGSDLHTGSNTLVFEVAQRDGFLSAWITPDR